MLCDVAVQPEVITEDGFRVRCVAEWWSRWCSSASLPKRNVMVAALGDERRSQSALPVDYELDEVQLLEVVHFTAFRVGVWCHDGRTR